MEVMLAAISESLCDLKNQLEEIEGDFVLLQDRSRDLCVEVDMILGFSGLELEFPGLELDG